MSVPERPDEDVQWAEGPGADTQEPAALRPQGWHYGFVPPSAAFNWLQRSVGRWIQWLEAKVDGHVHDGGSDPGSVAKVDPKEHIDWEDHGYLQGLDYPQGVHRLTHRSRADGSRAKMRFETGTLSGHEVQIDDPDAPINIVQFKVEHESDENSPVIFKLLSALHETFNQDFRAIFSGATVEAKALNIDEDVEIGGAVTAQNTPDALLEVNTSTEVTRGYSRGPLPLTITKESTGIWDTNISNSDRARFIMMITTTGDVPVAARLHYDSANKNIWQIHFEDTDPHFFQIYFKRVQQ